MSAREKKQRQQLPAPLPTLYPNALGIPGIRANGTHKNKI